MQDRSAFGRLASCNLECRFEDIPISSATYEEVARVRGLIREEVRQFYHAQEAAAAAGAAAAAELPPPEGGARGGGAKVGAGAAP